MQWQIKVVQLAAVAVSAALILAAELAMGDGGPRDSMLILAGSVGTLFLRVGGGSKL